MWNNKEASKKINWKIKVNFTIQCCTNPNTFISAKYGQLYKTTRKW